MLRSRRLVGFVLSGAIACTSLVSAATSYAAEPTNPSSVIQNLIATLNNRPPATTTAATTSAPAPAPAPAPPAPAVPNPEPTVAPAAPAAPGTSAPAASAADGVLTYDNFPAFAANLGYDCKKISDSTWQIDASRGSFNMTVNVLFDTKHEVVWFFTFLREVPDLNKVPAEAYRRLLESNMTIGPSHFYMSKAKLFLGRALENHHVTSVKFRRELDQFFLDCQATENLWSVEKWNEIATPETTTSAGPAPSLPSS
ncbi:MAG: YbjN domain-containing protein [Pirellulales bacterium]|nr:YbjN domain-containing protein [Pirellulales bacterium]